MVYFQINKSNLIFNVKRIKARLQDGVKFCAMVKGNAYGHNLKVISNIIKDYVDYFGVATIDEGIYLRNKCGIENSILCVGKCDVCEIKNASIYNIDITVESLEQLNQICNMDYDINVHIKVDTGMHRLGIDNIKDFKSALKLINGRSNIKLKGLFSHFNEGNENNYIRQKKLFDEYLKLCPQNIIAHCANSLASRYNSLQYDMVRIGLSLYGYGESKLKKVLKIKSKVVSLRKVKKGEVVGYEQGYRAENDCFVATVFLGYYDGINRKLSNNAFVKINNKQYAIIGNICMDMFMVLVDDTVKVDDQVIVFEDADYWAKIVGTIPYEILTSFKADRMVLNIVE
ncbi:MAG: alanine racemase [Clostridia bacterium]|nr:alanine racemase [Clostridia bacterium]